MADKVILNKSKLIAIGDAIRSKTGTTASLTLDAMANEISNISTGTDTSDATAKSSDILAGKTAYVGEGKVEGTIETYDYEGSNEDTNTLKKLLDTTKSCYYLFYKYTGESVEDLISYSDTENVTSMLYMFYQCSNLKTIPPLNTSNVTTMQYMVYYCQNLQTIPQLNTSKVNNMSYMFYGCGNLQTIPQLDTSNVTNMGGMFRECRKLQTVPQLDTLNVTNMGAMFQNCTDLQTIDLTSMDKITTTSKTSYFANGCYSLTKLIIRNMTVIPPLDTNSFTNCYHFTGTVNSTYNSEGLKDGRIYVPDNMVDSLKQATNWSAYADIIVPLSTLEE